MNNRINIAWDVNKEDVRKLTENSITHIISRFSSGFNKDVLGLGEAISTEGAPTILAHIQKLLINCEEMARELEAVVPLIHKIPTETVVSDDNSDG